LPLKLHTLGALFVSRDDAEMTPIPVQRRPLAVLALVASAGQLGISRERIGALLWPESDEAHARNNLKQAVFSLRRSLAIDPFAHDTDTLRLDESVLTSDLRTFRDAVAADRLLDAIRVYRGPFLDSFELAGLGEFEHWVAADRDHLAHAYMRALARLAVQAHTRGDGVESAEWWRGVLKVDPFHSRAVLGLCRSLRDHGQAPEALREIRAFRKRLQDELEAVPNPELLQLERDLRREITTSAVAERDAAEAARVAYDLAQLGAGGGWITQGSDAPAPRSARKEPIPVAHPAAVLSAAQPFSGPDRRRHVDPSPGAQTAVPTLPISTEPLGRRHFGAEFASANGRRRVSATALAAVLVGVLGLTALASPPRFRVALPVVAVEQFVGQPSPVDVALGRASAELIAATLRANQGWRVLSPSAVRDSLRSQSQLSVGSSASEIGAALGADVVVRGELTEANGRVALRVVVHCLRDGDSTVVTGAAETTDLFDMLAQLSRGIERAARPHVRTHGRRASISTTH
jgi:DNA-binding SARP family transcriptional activator